MQKLKKSLLPLFLVVAMLVMALSAGAVSSSQKPVEIEDNKQISCEFNYESTPYTGKKKTPKVFVTYKGQELTKNTDYTVSYSKNINVGTAKVTIKGVGQFTGSDTFTFKITKQKLHIGNKTLKKGQKFALVANVYLKDVETKVAANKITYKSSNTKIATVSSSGKIFAKKKGTCKITLTPKDKRFAAKTITVTVV